MAALNRPLISICFHFDPRYPDGAGSRSFHIYRILSGFFQRSFSFNRCFLHLSLNGEIKNIFFINFQWKRLAALLALLFSRHYILTKHFCFFHFILYRRFYSCGILYCNFLWAFPVLKHNLSKSVLVIDTHNYDPDWWDNLEANSKWPWERRLCRISKQRILEILNDLPKNTLLVHVSQEDADKYRRHRPDLTHLVLPNGCTIRPRSLAPAYSAPVKKVYFLGALNLQITRDAILHFDKNFWPQISTFSEFHLIGSGPVGFWKPFCAERGWHLHNNVPDDDLSRLLEGMHYLVLPFTYGAGSKLKFIDACARGIPVISTTHGVCGFNNLPATVRISEDPGKWASWISSPQGPTDAETASCLAFAKEYSWDSLVAKVWPQIQSHPPVP